MTFEQLSVLNEFSKELRVLRFSLLPLIIIFFATWLFGAIGFNFGLLAQITKNYLVVVDAENALFQFKEAEARMLWGITVLLYVCASLYFLFVSLKYLLCCSSKKILYFYLVLIAILIIARIFIFLQGIETSTPRGILFNLTFEILENSSYYTSSQLLFIKLFLVFLNVLSLTVPVVCLFAGCSMMWDCEKKATNDIKVLNTTIKHLSLLLNFGSLMMVAGIMHTQVWLHWSAVWIADKDLALTIDNFVSSLSLYWGTTYSLVIVAFYLPLANSLRRQAEILVEKNEEISKEEESKWLKENQFLLTPIEQLPKIFMMLAPLLAGTIGDTLTQIVPL